METQTQLRCAAMRAHTIVLQQQDRIAALRSELQSMEEDLAVSTSAENDALASLAKTECSQLCNRVTTQLPRELRDMVYAHLIPSHETKVDREYFRCDMDPVTKLHSYDPTRWQEKHHPEHFWKTEYCGEVFFQESVEKYYRTSTFKFGDDGGLIERFLKTEHLTQGYEPGELVSKVEVYLSAITYDRTSCIGYLFGCATKPERLVAALKGLEMLKSGSNITVHFATQAKDEKVKEQQTMTATACLVPVLRGLREAGYIAKLVLDRTSEVALGDNM